jgi:DNA-binding CsgD family transcriptional regulator
MIGRGSTRRPEVRSSSACRAVAVVAMAAVDLVALTGCSFPGAAGTATSVAARDLSAQGLWLPSVRPSARLTAREREIAGLAAGGLSSRAIAERLTLSVRTVDSHLSRVFTKLNVRGRQELRGIRDM